MPLSELHTAQDVPTELLQIAHMKGFCGLPNHKDVWLPLAAQIYSPNTFSESVFLLFPFLLLPREENVHFGPSEFGRCRAIILSFVLLTKCSKHGYVMAPACYVSSPFGQPWHSFIMYRRAQWRASQSLSLNRLREPKDHASEK